MDEPLIVGVIDEPEIDKAELARQMGADVLEARFDLWKTSMDTSRQVLRDLKKVGLDIIGTNRWIIEGGGFEGSEPDRIGFLISCMDLLDYVDIELECEIMWLSGRRSRGLR